MSVPVRRRPKMPPTTPPTMAPTLLDRFDAAGVVVALVESAGNVEDEEEVGATATDVEVEVGAGIAVLSGRPASCCGQHGDLRTVGKACLQHICLQLRIR